MNKKLKTSNVLIILFIILIIISIFKLYPKSGTFNDLVLNKYPDTKFIHLNIYVKYNTKNCEDVNKMNEFLSYLKKIEIKEYTGKISYNNNDIYTIDIFRNDSNILGITLQNENFIQIDMRIDDRHILKKYKIINNTLDINYIKQFYESM